MRDSNFDHDVSPWWRLADKLDIVQASLLVLGIEPQGLSDHVENQAASHNPSGYAAVKAGIIGGIQSKALAGQLCFVTYQDRSGEWEIDQTRYDLSASTVEVASLIKWLSSRGFSSGFFFADETSKRGPRDKAHPRYAPKLAAAIEAWESYDETAPGPGTAKQKLMKWLRLHAGEYALVDEDGKPREGVIEELAGIANWAPKGGAPKAAAPDPPAKPDDDEIPF